MNTFTKSYLLLLTICLMLFVLACQNEQKSKSSTPREATLVVQKDTIVAVIPKKPIKKNLVADYDTTQWTDILFMDSTILIDLKYASTDNFVKVQMYECPRCFLRPKVAKILLEIHKDLQKKGLGLKLFDCYRPLSIQQRLWDKVPDATYVTNPKKGSMHNRGLAVDLTIVNEKGEELDMGTPFDSFGRKAHHTHTDLPKEVLENRHLLKSKMESVGFKSIRTEWWHYSYRYAKSPLADMVWDCE